MGKEKFALMETTSMSYFDKHVFFCVNQRAAGESCCANAGAQKMRDYVKDKVKALKLDADGNRIRINSAGCLGRCEEGPVLVVYPEGVWYTYVDESDLDEIIEEHLKCGRPVARLKI
jgi:(2Fe-2S) ferredoxin